MHARKRAVSARRSAPSAPRMRPECAPNARCVAERVAVRVVRAVRVAGGPAFLAARAAPSRCWCLTALTPQPARRAGASPRAEAGLGRAPVS